jgi:hypothetical protein
MLNTFQDFINHNPRYKQLEYDNYFKSIYGFLSERINIVNMVEASKWQKPALSGCVVQLETKFPDLLKQPYNDYFIKQSVGAMIKVILAPFGYIPLVPKRLSNVKSEFFTSAHTYHLDENQKKLELVQTWEIVNAKI